MHDAPHARARRIQNSSLVFTHAAESADPHSLEFTLRALFVLKKKKKQGEDLAESLDDLHKIFIQHALIINFV